MNDSYFLCTFLFWAFPDPKFIKGRKGIKVFSFLVKKGILNMGKSTLLLKKLIILINNYGRSFAKDAKKTQIAVQSGSPSVSSALSLQSSCFFTPPGARTYDHLKKTREEERLKRTMLSEVLQYIQDSSACQQWLRRQADM